MIVATTLDLIQAREGSMAPLAIARSTAEFGVENWWAGRLWQSRQSMWRSSRAAMLFVNSLVLYSVTVPSGCVKRTQGMERRWRSVAMNSTLLEGLACQ